MKIKKRVVYKRILLYALIVALVVYIFLATKISSIYEGILIIMLSSYLIFTLLQKDYLLVKLFIKAENQKQFIDNITKYSTDIFLYKNKDFKLVFYNPPLLSLLGLPEEEDDDKKFIGKNDFELFSHDIAKYVREHDEKVIRNGETVRYKLKSDIGVIHDVVSAPIIKNKRVTGIISLIRNISQQEAFQKELETKQRELEVILDNLPIIAILKDLNGNYITSNRCFNESIKYEWKSLNTGHSNEIKEEDEEVIKNKTTITFNKRIEIIKGVYSWYQIVKAPIFNQNGEVEKIAVFLKNIEDEKKIEEQKNTFVATLTHDLKNPTLAQIRALELLIKGSFGATNSEQKEIIEQLLSSCNYMLSMIMTIIDSYRYEEGNIVLKTENFDISELTKEICKEFIYLANDREQTLSVTLPENPINLWADKLQIKRAISNLISNAINYGREKSNITILIEEQKSSICLTVTNLGEHISEKCLHKIFDKYVSKSSAFNKISSGLGLYLTKKIIEIHSGNMIAQSSHEGFNTFGFTIEKSINKQEMKSLENIT